MGKEFLSITGGARVGWINATWPLAKLTVQKNTIELKAALIGKYSFTQEQIISIKKYTTIPILAWGILIIHNVSEYPKKIKFWSFSNPESIITKIQETGFLPSADPLKIPPNIGIPVKWQTLVLIIALWNILLFADMGGFPRPGFKPGIFSLLALFLLFVGSISIWKSSWLQNIILKPGRSPSEIKAWLNLLALVSGFLFVIMSITNMIE